MPVERARGFTNPRKGILSSSSSFRV